MTEQAGDKPSQKGVPDGLIVGLKNQVKDLKDRLAKAEEAKKALQRDLEWSRELSGDEETDKIKKAIFDSNIELTTRESELAARESEVNSQLLGLKALSIAANYQIDVAELDGLDSEADMISKAKDLRIETLQSKAEKPEPTPGSGLEFGHQMTPGKKSPAEMSDEEFEEHKKQLLKEYQQKQLV